MWRLSCLLCRGNHSTFCQCPRTFPHIPHFLRRQAFTAKFIVSLCALCNLLFRQSRLGAGLCKQQRNALAQLRPLAILRRRGKIELKMTREYPRELRWRVVFLLKGGWRVADIASVLQAGETFARKIKRIVDANQSIEYRPRQGNLERLLSDFSTSVIRRLLMFKQYYLSP